MPLGVEAGFLMPQGLEVGFCKVHECKGSNFIGGSVCRWVYNLLALLGLDGRLRNAVMKQGKHAHILSAAPASVALSSFLCILAAMR